MRAINDNVFIERFGDIESKDDIFVSEKACIKSYLGIVKEVERDKNVTIGDVVHIPHYAVLDVEVDGKQYALTKHSKLFAKKQGDTYVPINQYVRVRKCVNDHIRDESGKIALYMTDNHIEYTNWVEVIDVADDCQHIGKEHIGLFCVSPESSDLLQRLEFSKEYMLKETEIKFTTNGEEMIKPVGDTVILEIYNDGSGDFGVVTNSKIYTVVSCGLGLRSKTGIVLPVSVSAGDKVIVQDEKMPTISIGGKEYIYTNDDNISMTVGD